MGLLVVINYGEDAGEENEENIEEANGDFISMKGNLDVLKKIKEKVA